MTVLDDVCGRETKESSDNDTCDGECRDGRQQRYPKECCAQQGRASHTEPSVPSVPPVLTMGISIEIHHQQVGVVRKRDEPTVLIVLDDPSVVHLREMGLIEGNVDPLALVGVERVDAGVVLPSSDLFCKFTECDRFVRFEQVCEHFATTPIL